ncbi:MAG: FAD-dependent oxidoreductase [Mesorhizobium sp.]|nr:MAG: FAD-dependent oxidoreductase [Mesorhizobium sp.]
MDNRDADVLIIGGGPTGLALATELTMRGKRVCVVERNERTGVQPRAKTTNVRTMAHMRRWGLVPEVRRRSPLPQGFPRRVLFQHTLFANPIVSFDDSFCASPQRRDEFPEHAEFIPQYVIEGILAEKVASEPLATVMFGWELVSFAEESEGVVARVRGRDGAERELRAPYIIGADGGRSSVRRLLGIEMRGKSNLTTFATLILRIPGLIERNGLPRGLFHFIVRPDAASIIGPLDQGDVWYFSRVAQAEVPTEDILNVARRAIGCEVEIEVLARDNWVVHSLLADGYRKGRAFLAGDACHLHSPFGGHGMNLGIGDAVDLAWKLAAALGGWAGEGLLDSYAVERAQVHKAVIDSATRNVGALSENFADPILGETGPEADAARTAAAAEIRKLKTPEFHSLGLVLGYRYTNSPAIALPDREGPPLEVSRYVPDATPGHLAPHFWIDETISIYDLFGIGFTLIVGEGQRDVSALVEDVEATGIPLKVLRLDEALIDRHFEAPLVLVRPDQHVAWRGNAIPESRRLIEIMRGERRSQSEPGKSE